MRSRYARAASTVATGGLRLGITIARANCRAVNATTLSSAAPSRRWRCQSSGRMIVSVSMPRSLTLAPLAAFARSGFPRDVLVQGERLRVELVPRTTGDRRRDANGCFHRQLLEQQPEHPLALRRLRSARRTSAGDDHHQLAARPVRIGLEPAARLAE